MHVGGWLGQVLAVMERNDAAERFYFATITPLPSRALISPLFQAVMRGGSLGSLRRQSA